MNTHLKENFGDFIEKLTSLYSLGSEEQNQQKEKETDILQKKLELKLKEIDKKEKELSKKDADISKRERQHREESLRRKEDGIKDMLKRIEDKQGILDKEEQEKAKRLLQLEKDKERLVASQKFEYKEDENNFDDEEDIADKLQTRMDQTDPSNQEPEEEPTDSVEQDPNDILSKLSSVMMPSSHDQIHQMMHPDTNIDDEDNFDVEEGDCDCEEGDEDNFDVEEGDIEEDTTDGYDGQDLLDKLARLLKKKSNRDDEDREFIQDDEDDQDYDCENEDCGCDEEDYDDNHIVQYDEEDDELESEYADESEYEYDDNNNEYDDNEDILSKIRRIASLNDDESDDMEDDDDVEEGYKIMPPIDRERYTDIPELEGPFTLRSGKVVYYDPKEGKYYDRDSDLYMSSDEYFQHDKDNTNEESDDILNRISRLEKTLSISEAPSPEDIPQGPNPAMQNQPSPEQDPLAGPDAPMDNGSEPPMPEEEEIPIEIEDKVKDIEDAQGFELDSNNAYEFYDKIRGLLNDEESIKGLNQEYETIPVNKRKITPAKYVYDKVISNIKDKRDRSSGAGMDPSMMGGDMMGGDMMGGDMMGGGAPMGADIGGDASMGGPESSGGMV